MLCEKLPHLQDVGLRPVVKYPNGFNHGRNASEQGRFLKQIFKDAMSRTEFAAAGGPPSFCVIPRYRAEAGSREGLYVWKEAVPASG